jgi:hypothetical protein
MQVALEGFTLNDITVNPSLSGVVFTLLLRSDQTVGDLRLTVGSLSPGKAVQFSRSIRDCARQILEAENTIQ